MAEAAGALTELADIQPRIRAREHKRASIHPRVEHDLRSSSFVRMDLADSLVQLGGEFRLALAQSIVLIQQRGDVLLPPACDERRAVERAKQVFLSLERVALRIVHRPPIRHRVLGKLTLGLSEADEQPHDLLRRLGVHEEFAEFALARRQKVRAISLVLLVR